MTAVVLKQQSVFNAGDGIRFFFIPGLRTNNILNLPWTLKLKVFRFDEASVTAGGCRPCVIDICGVHQ